MNSEVLETFKNNLPPKPYCTDDLDIGLMIRPAEQAITKRYIQFNKPTDLRWFVYDIDRGTAQFDWQDLHVPQPNMTVRNPKNGHAHLFYGLEIPVHIQVTAKKNPIRYAGAIDVAMIRTLGADDRYRELISKNPLCDYWQTTVWRTSSYDLAEIADYLDLTPYSDERRRLPEIGLGRNCNLFDLTRFFAYREIRKTKCSQKEFIRRCIQFAKIHNTFATPLPQKECVTIGKSVGKWVYDNMSTESFQQWGEARRKKSVETRQIQKMDKMTMTFDLYEKGFSQKEIVQILKISEREVKYYFAIRNS